MSFKDIEDSVVGLCNSVFGDSYSYTPNGGTAIQLQSVFKHEYVEVESVVSLKPTLRIRLSDLTAKPGKGDTVVIETVTYKVAESREDGHGGSLLILKV